MKKELPTTISEMIDHWSNRVKEVHQKATALKGPVKDHIQGMSNVLTNTINALKEDQKTELFVDSLLDPVEALEKLCTKSLRVQKKSSTFYKKV